MAERVAGHPHIVNLVDAGTVMREGSNPTMLLVYEHAGVSLHAFMKQFTRGVMPTVFHATSPETFGFGPSPYAQIEVGARRPAPEEHIGFGPRWLQSEFLRG